MRSITRAAWALALAATLTACSSSPSPTEPPGSTPAATTSASPAATTAAPASTTAAATSAYSTPSPSASASPTPSPTPSSTAPSAAAPAGIEGRWCPTKDSTETFCVSVTGKKVVWENGGTDTLVGQPYKGEDGSLSYRFKDNPFGTFYAKGIKLDPRGLGDLKDLPQQDRIFNSQTLDLYVRASSQSSASEPTVAGFPAALQGKWCSRDQELCFSLKEFRARAPESFLSDTSAADDAPGATDYILCGVDEGGRDCSLASTQIVRHFPAGVPWNCKNMGAKSFGLSKCVPDYTKQHDVSRERLMIVPNHQQDADYYDTPPMYKVKG